MFFIVIGLMIFGDLLLWWWADRQFRVFRRAKLWRWAVGLHNGGQVLLLIAWVLSRTAFQGIGDWFWVPVSAWIYVWHLIVLPAAVVGLGIGYGIAGIARLLMRKDDLGLVAPAAADRDTQTMPRASRREFLGAAAAIAPQIALAGALGAAAVQVGKFRIRRMELPFAQLPRALDGVTIAHVSDTHVGRFVRERELEAIVEATAGLKPDVIAFTGDLIDFSMADLPKSIGAMQQLQRIAPLALCVGNHDLFESGYQFRRRVLDAGLPLLLDGSMPIPLRGQTLEMLGLDWGVLGERRQAGIDTHMRQLDEVRRSNVFSILLAHHPHAFDPAAAAKIPLTLAGHTHGGQLMLTERIGLGRVYKYWSGLYEKPGAKLVVSNGVGNWFPLRINAPAEIVQITLRSA